MRVYDLPRRKLWPVAICNEEILRAFFIRWFQLESAQCAERSNSILYIHNRRDPSGNTNALKERWPIDWEWPISMQRLSQMLCSPARSKAAYLERTSSASLDIGAPERARSCPRKSLAIKPIHKNIWIARSCWMLSTFIFGVVEHAPVNELSSPSAKSASTAALEIKVNKKQRSLRSH